MEINKVTITPNQFSLEPELNIVVHYSFRDNYSTPIKYNCGVFMERIRIAFMHEVPGNINQSMPIAATTSIKGGEQKNIAVFVAPLSRIALDKLADSRSRNPKGDVHLNLKFEFTFVEPVFSKIKQTISIPQKKIVEVPTLTESVLFHYKTQVYSDTVTISRSNWLSDFCPVFENRRYQIFELPIVNVADENDEIHVRINEAINALTEIEKARNNGDWNLVVKESRPIWELINHKAELDKLLHNDGMDPLTVESFKVLITSFFDFASKFIHKISKSKSVMKPNNASKEDAELIYAMAFSIINLISRKLFK